MRSIRTLGLGLFVAVGLLSAGSAEADQTICTSMITSVPHTITQTGVHCLTAPLNLACNSVAPAAITVNASSVVIDLNGFNLQRPSGGCAAYAGNQNVGVFANSRRSITVRNGTIRGFYKGVFFDDTSSPGASQGHLIENVRSDLSTHVTFHIRGLGSIVRNSAAVDTGGSTVTTEAYGIWMDGAANRVMDNDVSGTVHGSGGTAAAVRMQNADGAVVGFNRIGNSSILASSFGIQIDSGDVQVFAARITSMLNGIFYGGSASGKYTENLTSNVTNPYTGGTDIVGTNH